MRRCLFSILIWTLSASAQTPANAAGNDSTSPTIASEGTDQATLGTPVPLPTPTIASEGTDQATLGTPIPVPEENPTIATEGTNQATLTTPTIIAPPKTPLPTVYTSLVTDTRGFSFPHSVSDSVVTSEQQKDTEANTANPSGGISGTTTSPGPVDAALSPEKSTAQPNAMGKAGSEVAVSIGALVMAVAGLTWVFAEF